MKAAPMNERPIVRSGFSAFLQNTADLRRSFRAIFLIALCILSVSADVASSQQAKCSSYWLKMWNSRSDTQKWAYVNLSYYAGSGAHPMIEGYSSAEISLYLAALAIKNKQGLELYSHSISLEAMDRAKKAAAMRYVIARYFGLSLPDWEDDNRPDQCVFSESSACLERLVRRLLPKAEKMQHFLESAVQSGRLGNVSCEGGIQYFERARLR